MNNRPLLTVASSLYQLSDPDMWHESSLNTVVATRWQVGHLMNAHMHQDPKPVWCKTLEEIVWRKLIKESKHLELICANTLPPSRLFRSPPCRRQSPSLASLASSWETSRSVRGSTAISNSRKTPRCHVMSTFQEHLISSHLLIFFCIFGLSLFLFLLLILLVLCFLLSFLFCILFALFLVLSILFGILLHVLLRTFWA